MFGAAIFRTLSKSPDTVVRAMRFRTVFLVVYFALALNTYVDSNAQDLGDVHQHAIEQINSLNSYFRIARRGFESSDSFQASSAQQTKFATIKARLKKLNEKMGPIVSISDPYDRMDEYQVVIKEFNSLKFEFAATLSVEQQRWVDNSIFANLMLNNNQDFAKVLSEHYDISLEITKKQQAAIDAVRKRLRERQLEARLEYQSRLREIERESELEIGEALSTKQRQTLEEYSGKSFSEK